MFILQAILGIVLLLILGPGKVVDQSTQGFTMTFVVMGWLLGFAIAYLAGAIAKAIGQHRNAAIILICIIVLFGSFQLLRRGTMPKAPEGVELSEFQQNMFAVAKAQMNTPKILSIAGLVISIAGIAVGGLGSSKRPSGTPVTGQPGT